MEVKTVNQLKAELKAELKSDVESELTKIQNGLRVLSDSQKADHDLLSKLVETLNKQRTIKVTRIK